MRKLIAWNVMTLDGQFEGTTPWDLSFHELVWGPELEALSNEQLANAGVLLFGRKTYEGMAAYWTKETGAIADGMNRLRKVAVSNTLVEADWNNSEILSGDAVDGVRRLKAEEGGIIYVFGSAELLAALLPAGLVDEYRLCVAPIVQGSGNPLFKPAEMPVRMRLLEAKALKSGGAYLAYAPEPAAA